MSHNFLRSAGEWFGFTRRERRSSFFILFVTIFVFCIRYLFPLQRENIEIIRFESEVVKADSVKEVAQLPVPLKPLIEKEFQERKKITELNSCDSAGLEALPGLGPVLSARIIKYRNLLGGYVSVEQLREVYGLKPETYDMVSVLVTADTSLVMKINLNEADFRRLIRFPYFEKNEVTGILKYRELMGRIKSVDELVDNKILTSEKADKMRGYLDY